MSQQERALRDARFKAFKAMEDYLRQHGPVDTDTKNEELERLRKEAVAAVVALNEFQATLTSEN